MITIVTALARPASSYSSGGSVSSPARTGDDTPISMYLLILALAAGTITLLGLRKKKNRT